MIYIGNLKQPLQKLNISQENLNFGAIQFYLGAILNFTFFFLFILAKKRFANGNLIEP